MNDCGIRRRHHFHASLDSICCHCLKKVGCPSRWWKPVIKSWVALLKPFSPCPRGCENLMWVYPGPPGGSRRQFTSLSGREGRRLVASASPPPADSLEKVCQKRGLFCHRCARLCSKDRMYQPVLQTCVGPKCPLPQRSLPTEKRTKDVERQELIFVGANNPIICVSRPLPHSDLLIPLSTSVLIVLGAETLSGYSKS